MDKPSKSDPTKDVEFQKVVRTFLSTPPKRHDDMKSGKPNPAKAKSPAKRTKGKGRAGKSKA